MKSEFKVVSKKTGRNVFREEYASRAQAESEIVNAIRGALTKSEALDYYINLEPREIKKR